MNIGVKKVQEKTYTAKYFIQKCGFTFTDGIIKRKENQY